MVSKNQELALNCIFSVENTKKMNMRLYVIITLFHGCSREFEKHKANLDTRGSASAKFQFKDINVEAAYLRFQVFIHSKFFPDKLLGQVNVRVSELVSLSKIQQEAYATYEIVKSSKKRKKGDLKLCYKLSITPKDLHKVVQNGKSKVVSITPKDLHEVVPNGKPKVASNSLPAAIGNEIGLFKTVPSFRKPLVSLSWT